QRPKKLEQNALTIPGSRVTYAVGALALWRPSSSPQQIEQLFQQGEFRHFAIANPKIAPYGVAAMQWLEQSGQLKRLRPKLVYGENIAQTFQFVESGSAGLGLVALSQVIRSSNYMAIDPRLHQALEQQMVVVKSTRHKLLAQQFTQYLQSAPIRQLIQQQGYQTP
ncbi:MAG: molybdate ABC transporter substrate-binding protein, partial [Gammaproteobacteria bacterium]